MLIMVAEGYVVQNNGGGMCFIKKASDWIVVGHRNLKGKRTYNIQSWISEDAC